MTDDSAARLLGNDDQFTTCTFDTVALPTPLTNKEFNDCRFKGTDAKGARFEHLKFVDCTFFNCVFDSLHAVENTFENCRFYDSDSESGCSFKFATLRDCRFYKCELTLSNLTREDIYLTEFHGCQMSGADLSHATDAHAIGRSVELFGASLIDCNLAYLDLQGATLIEADLSGSRLSHAQLGGANLTGAVLADCDLHQVGAENVILEGCDLRGATVSGLDVRKVDVTGVKIHPDQALFLLQTLGMEIE
ncbi:MAG: pentapeptide repeat-containing protein [Gammaproteobacteria bacterium]|nr:pentapeptide repeat-containing protein [Gammaproteobacteria bacterium]